MLWPQIQSILITLSSHYGPDDVHTAQAQMQHYLGNRTYEGYGLKTVSLQVAIGLEESAKVRAEELRTLKHSTEVARQELDIKRANQNFYHAVLTQGKDGLLALLLSLNPEERQAFFSHLAQREQAEITERQDKRKILVDIAEKGDAIWERWGEQAVNILMEMLQGPGGQEEPPAEDEPAGP
jgi:hypothetical protein